MAHQGGNEYEYPSPSTGPIVQPYYMSYEEWRAREGYDVVPLPSPAVALPAQTQAPPAPAPPAPPVPPAPAQVPAQAPNITYSRALRQHDQNYDPMWRINMGNAAPVLLTNRQRVKTMELFTKNVLQRPVELRLSAPGHPIATLEYIGPDPTSSSPKRPVFRLSGGNLPTPRTLTGPTGTNELAEQARAAGLGWITKAVMNESRVYQGNVNLGSLYDVQQTYWTSVYTNVWLAFKAPLDNA